MKRLPFVVVSLFISTSSYCPLSPGCCQSRTCNEQAPMASGHSAFRAVRKRPDNQSNAFGMLHAVNLVSLTTQTPSMHPPCNIRVRSVPNTRLREKMRHLGPGVTITIGDGAMPPNLSSLLPRTTHRRNAARVAKTAPPAVLPQTRRYAIQLAHGKKLVTEMLKQVQNKSKTNPIRRALDATLAQCSGAPSEQTYAAACHHLQQAIDSMQKTKRARRMTPAEMPESSAELEVPRLRTAPTPPPASAYADMDTHESPALPALPVNTTRSAWSAETKQESFSPFSQAFLAGRAMEPADMDETPPICNNMPPWECVALFGDAPPGCTRGQSTPSSSLFV